MPLEQGSSKEVIGRNIAREEAAGKPEKQAVAIALHTANDDCSMIKDDPGHEVAFGGRDPMNTVDFGYKDAEPQTYMPAGPSVHEMGKWGKQMWSEEAEEGENANGITTPGV